MDNLLSRGKYEKKHGRKVQQGKTTVTDQPAAFDHEKQIMTREKQGAGTQRTKLVPTQFINGAWHGLDVA